MRGYFLHVVAAMLLLFAGFLGGCLFTTAVQKQVYTEYMPQTPPPELVSAARRPVLTEHWFYTRNEAADLTEAAVSDGYAFAWRRCGEVLR